MWGAPHKPALRQTDPTPRQPRSNGSRSIAPVHSSPSNPHVRRASKRPYQRDGRRSVEQTLPLPSRPHSSRSPTCRGSAHPHRRSNAASTQTHPPACRPPPPPPRKQNYRLAFKICRCDSLRSSHSLDPTASRCSPPPTNRRSLTQSRVADHRVRPRPGWRPWGA